MGGFLMLKMKNLISLHYKKLSAVAFSAFLMITTAMPAYASGVGDSQIVKGTEKLIGDVTTWLMVLAPIVAGLLIIYFCIRRSAADEMDQKKWNTDRKSTRLNSSHSTRSRMPSSA
jgi:ABC-type molybdate transport system permease subunit